MASYRLVAFLFPPKRIIARSLLKKMLDPLGEKKPATCLAVRGTLMFKQEHRLELEKVPARVLLVEDSKFYSAVIRQQVETLPNIILDSATTLKDARQLLEAHSGHYTMALVDLNLPDAPNGEIVDVVGKHEVPTVVFSSNFNPKTKEKLFAKGIVDYVMKDSPVALEYLVELVKRLLSQSEKKVLVASKCAKARRKQVQSLNNLQLSCWACESGDEAAKILRKHEDIALVLIGDELKDCSGVELVSKLRKDFRSSHLSILAIPDTETDFASQYLRYGANDFLRQPYSPEEFQCRINNALKSQKLLTELEAAATRDFLTGLFNRRAFFDTAATTLAFAMRNNQPLALAMVDIDHFKNVNDTYGHDVGDFVIKKVAEVLQKEVRGGDTVARVGGEEFCLLMPNLDSDNINTIFTRVRAAINAISVPTPQGVVHVSASFGITIKITPDIEVMMKAADQALYQAKRSGRDKFVMAEQTS
ncbi:MAG: hypothetical protein COB37_03425 [Kordiimonadales bacterium]|nr:MAG: hypothetical protein COB37_03425 [Kordiimonadales bacterium]